jgi:succinoglycan biosynthesis transport protein ExoP
MGEGSGEEGVLREWLSVVSRQRWIVLVAVVVAPMLALAVSHSEQHMYQATAEVLVNEQNPSASVLNLANAAASPPDRYAATQASLARVARVAEMAVKAARVPGHPAGELLANSSVSADPNADLLTFSVSDPVPAYAVRLADAYATQFTAYRKKLDTAALASAIADTRRKLDTIAAAGGSRSLLYLQLEGTERNLQALQTLQEAGSSAVVVDRPTSASQTSPKTKRNVILGLLVGVALGLLVAFLRESLDTRVSSAEELEERLGMPLLGEVPALGRSQIQPDQPATLFDASAATAAFTLAAGNFEIARIEHDVHSILITSIDEDGGTSSAAANVAVALTRMGRHVVLLDLDLAHASSMERLFGLGGRPGLRDLAAGTELEKALNVIEVRGIGDRAGPVGAKLEVMTAGAAQPLPLQFLWSSTVLDALAALPKRCDVLLINGPRLAGGVDAQWIAGHAEGLLLLASVQTKRARISEARRILEASPVRKLGVVVTRPSSHISRLRSVLAPAFAWDGGEPRLPAKRGPEKDADASKGNGARRTTPIDQRVEVALKRIRGAYSRAEP